MEHLTIIYVSKIHCIVNNINLNSVWRSSGSEKMIIKKAMRRSQF